MKNSNTTIGVKELNDYFHKSDFFATHLGIEIVEVCAEYAIVTMPLTDIHRNGMGNAHGGAIYSLVDMAFASAAHVMGEFFVTAQSSVSYLSPGRIGPLRAVATKIRYGKTLGTFNVCVFDADETIVATAIMTGYNTHISINDL